MHGVSSLNQWFYYSGHPPKPDLDQSQVETQTADKLCMEQLIYGVISVILFCICSHLFIRNLTYSIPLMSTERVYARAAMQVGKVYKTLAWGAMSGVFLVAVVVSFSQVFTSL